MFNILGYFLKLIKIKQQKEFAKRQNLIKNLKHRINQEKFHENINNEIQKIDKNNNDLQNEIQKINTNNNDLKTINENLFLINCYTKFEKEPHIRSETNQKELNKKLLDAEKKFINILEEELNKDLNNEIKILEEELNKDLNDEIKILEDEEQDQKNKQEFCSLYKDKQQEEIGEEIQTIITKIKNSNNLSPEDKEKIINILIEDKQKQKKQQDKLNKKEMKALENALAENFTEMETLQTNLLNKNDFTEEQKQQIKLFLTNGKQTDANNKETKELINQKNEIFLEIIKQQLKLQFKQYCGQRQLKKHEKITQEKIHNTNHDIDQTTNLDILIDAKIEKEKKTVELKETVTRVLELQEKISLLKIKETRNKLARKVLLIWYKNPNKRDEIIKYTVEYIVFPFILSEQKNQKQEIAEQEKKQKNNNIALCELVYQLYNQIDLMEEKTNNKEDLMLINLHTKISKEYNLVSNLKKQANRSDLFLNDFLYNNRLNDFLYNNRLNDFENNNTTEAKIISNWIIRMDATADNIRKDNSKKSYKLIILIIFILTGIGFACVKIQNIYKSDKDKKHKSKKKKKKNSNKKEKKQNLDTKPDKPNTKNPTSKTENNQNSYTQQYNQLKPMEDFITQDLPQYIYIYRHAIMGICFAGIGFSGGLMLRKKYLLKKKKSQSQTENIAWITNYIIYCINYMFQ